MSEAAELSVVIDARLKSSITALCKKRGVSLSDLVEEALIEHLEDVVDLEAFRQRRSEVTSPLDKVDR